MVDWYGLNLEELEFFGEVGCIVARDVAESRGYEEVPNIGGKGITNH